ncbi:outer membrane lipoprotein carrier protein LolA [Pricia sp. S334]|uniref:Outer membrane lipoprotein carrier protein LolA n=1 Tax=Pricia mediterranea TaxID=3076079 RepID=A0ABU3L9Q6_9FLAO|nr:outer membrane lipoprotein carrier protein LolA [Pricia sp. S334]MDT7830466.1 outer membrane lipoprotein carrier protein LolA [Pricia sp. S334]
MNRIYFLICTLVFSTISATAQGSDEAKALLEEVYNKVKGYDNIVVDFKYVLNNAEAGINQETRGDVTLEGEKYVGDFFGAKQIYDGSKVYTIVPENQEVTIEDKSEDENALTPAKMLTFYRDGHKYEMDILQNVNGRKIQYVKLTPMDTDSETESILLGIDAETKHIYKVIEKGKNGTTTTITVNSFKTDQPLSETLFTFDRKKYEDEGYYIIES